MKHLGLLAFSAALLTAGKVHAETDTTPVDDIVVTAQKREQAAQDVGASLISLSGEAARERGISSIEDLERVVPGLTFARTTAGPPVLTLRGVGFYDSTLSASPAVSVYLDESPLALPSYLQVGVIDIARVEVLQGPQGTLYGENSTGGAINYIAAKPTDRLHEGGTISFGRFNTLEAEGYVSGPLTSTVKARLALKTVQGGDWQRSYTSAATNGATRQGAARAIVEWEPSASAKLALNVNGWIDRSDTQAVQLIEVACANASTCVPALQTYPTAPSNARAADWTPGYPAAHDAFFQTTLRSDIALSHTVTLTTLGGYQRFHQDKHLDEDGTALQALNFRQLGRVESFNQEVRLAGEAGRLRWLAGTYGAWQTSNETFFGDVVDGSLAQPLPGIMPRFTTVGGAFRFHKRDLAAFGNAEVRLSEHLTLIGGLRYTNSLQTFYGCQLSGADPTLGETLAFLSAAARGTLPQIDPVPQDGCIQIDAATLKQGATRNRLAQDNVSWRGNVNYKTDGGALLYASVARGYKSGSFPSLSVSSSIQFAPVTQESLLAYEAGVKAPLAGGAVRIEAAGFYYDYRDKQVRGRVVDPVFGVVEALVNIPKSRVLGFEGTVRARPATGIDLSVSATYADSKVQRFTGYDQNGALSDFAGSAFPYSPRFQMVADAAYEWAIGKGRRAFLGANLTHHSATSAGLGNDPELRLRSYTTLDLHGGLRAADDSWSLSLFGRNVTNAYYWNNMYRFTDTLVRIAARPVTYGLMLSLRH
ncbi:TonB-dependent receptor [Novosphingobium terrae]|uniref:TonB-dependent receptor n=1 Tax=Novosphingobium terrae TaxID=2726189 RepID=UPI00197F1A1C|nr:TonB-dependent receptor [Novosphingobium terrae]